MPKPLYTLLLWLLLPLALFKLAWRAIRQPEYLHHIPERFGFYRMPPPTRPLIWLHAVSVGETRAAEPLVAELRRRYPQHAILLTQTTPTGREAARQLFGDEVMRVYLPYDLPFAMRRFLRHFRPCIGLIMETELWFNLIAACRTQQVPLLLVNARLSERSARGYGRLGALTREGLRGLSALAAQTEADAARLRALGSPQVTVMGNLKFDVTPPPAQLELGEELRQRFGAGRPVWLAASTRDGEEELILDALRAADVPQLLTVIVPRHPQRFDEVAALLEKRGLKYVRRSALPADSLSPQPSPVRGAGMPPETQVVLGDSMGEMYAYYAACDAAFIGGSLLPLGGQNLIEACAVGKPVLVGPHTWNFAQVAEAAVEAGAARRVQDAVGLAQALRELFAEAPARVAMGQRGLAFTAQHRGASGRCLALVERFIAPAG